MIKALGLMCTALVVVAAPFAQAQTKEVCVKHIEAPSYPGIAVIAHLTGEVPVQVTIDAGGTVSATEVLGGNKASEILQRNSLENGKRWTFTNPQRAPYTLIIRYEYRLDGSLPTNARKVLFDLPAHVTLLAGLPVINSENSRTKRYRRKSGAGREVRTRKMLPRQTQQSCPANCV